MADADRGYVRLAEVIGQVRSELEAAQRDGEGQALHFAVEKVSLEFAVQVHTEGNGKAGLRIGVVTAELGGTLAKDTTHRIQVDLQPQQRGGGQIRVGGRSDR